MAKLKQVGIPPSSDKGGQLLVGVDEIMLRTRCNPLLRSINLIKKIKNPLVRLDYLLKIAPYFYATARQDAKNPLSPSQSVKNAAQAHRVLSALENNIKRQKKTLVEDFAEVENIEKSEKDESRPLSDPGTGLQEGHSGSDSPSLGNGQAEVQA